ncbi:helix-turn-helix domain-containing protein [Enorma massiliensis]|uniref:helix-turn-helix domain-containing protein n=1 Tax=Enorma massiliensis TaxID=1472761 RepID=UPI0002D5D211|nr:helix-turn-helix domain-containing protein [Enorma massiliensis]
MNELLRHDAAATRVTPVAAADLEGVPSAISGRHAFGHERLLVLIANKTAAAGGLNMSKREIADVLGVNVHTIDRAVKRLKDEGLIEAVAIYDARGAQQGNRYRSTDVGVRQAGRLVGAAE